ncbi:hypothetical protein M947_11320 [Sulfurimonas hongkongensis]|uniref:Uncharacterized protein n=1 Tax=Sulfurimonas hongkongensis TaxID=1172190 RepID=T0J8P5_9BACT|nr:hypothetical protein M947_11320 [Sulfurimonas hongkongensis]
MGGVWNIESCHFEQANRHPEQANRHPEQANRHPEQANRHPELDSGSKNWIPCQARNDG